MKKIELELVSLSSSVSQSQSYAVFLGELGGIRKFSIVIGGFEAQAIAVGLERMQPTRPLTHDLFKNFFLAFNVELKEIIITNVQEGIFYSKLICSNETDTIEIDSRTSDAIALAVRFSCPIYTYENILESISIEVNDGNDKNTQFIPESKNDTSFNELKHLSITELNHYLNEVLEQEDYIKAIAIRDELKSRGL